LSSAAGISIIIPVLHETERIGALIGSIRELKGGDEVEIIVVDGAPELETIGAIGREDVIKLSSKMGRAFQMNTGANNATGDIIMFLHADTRLPSNAINEIRSSLKDRKNSYGAFKLAFERSSVYLDLIAWLDNVRVSLTKVPYGDQCIFFKRSDLQALGGFKEMMFLEDVELMRRAKGQGLKCLIIDDKVVTSSRRFKDDGYVHHSIRYFIVHFLYWLGVSPDRMARYYRAPNEKK